MKRNILILTDFSNDAYNALFYATQLFKNEKCTFHILHAYDRSSGFKEEMGSKPVTKNVLNFLIDSTNEGLRETVHKINGDTDNNPLHEFIKVANNDSLENAVKEYTREHLIYLIVMGTKGKTGAFDIFFGGNTIHLVKSKIYCPLLCIPKQIDYRPISQMAYITSFWHNLAEDSLKIVKSIASNHKASVNIISIDDGDMMKVSQEKNKASLNAYFEDGGLQFHTIARNKTKAETVVRFSKKHSIDFLVMYYYPHFFLDKLFREPLLIDLSFYTEIPLLILPYKE